MKAPGIAANNHSVSDGPCRTCVVCRNKYPKKALDRYVWENGRPRMDSVHNMNGRGVYCCSDESCQTAFQRLERKWPKLFKVV